MKKSEKITLNKEDERTHEDMASFLSDVFSNHVVAKTHIDEKINWLLGVSGLIMSMTITIMFDERITYNKSGIIIIFLFSLISFIVCLISLDQPNFLKTKGEKTENYMFYNSLKNKSGDEIFQIYKNMKNHDDLIKQYAYNVYDVINGNIMFKKKYFMAARNILLSGIIIGSLLIILSLI